MAALHHNQESVTAEVPYLRSELELVHVDFTSRNLDDKTVERRTVQIRNGRAAAEPPSLEREGFEIATWASRVVNERLEELTADRPPLEVPQVELDYWDETIPLIQQLSGAREVLALHASVVRFSARAKKKEMMTPAGWAHLDYAADEAAVQLERTLQLSGREVQPFGRYVLYQSWRALSAPPQDFPLAVCDARTVATSDLIPIEYHLTADQGEFTYRTLGSRFSERHQWWWYPDMSTDEMILFIGFDSLRPEGPNTLHVAFEDTTAPDPVPRSSMESRYFALFD